jgi:hypothetical protein
MPPEPAGITSKERFHRISPVAIVWATDAAGQRSMSTEWPLSAREIASADIRCRQTAHATLPAARSAQMIARGDLRVPDTQRPADRPAPGERMAGPLEVLSATVRR